MDLSELLGVEVDVVTEAGLKPRVATGSWPRPFHCER